MKVVRLEETRPELLLADLVRNVLRVPLFHWQKRHGYGKYADKIICDNISIIKTSW